MINWQKFRDDFCKKCMHYYYEFGKKVWSEQVKYCHRAEGECKGLLCSVVGKARKEHHDKINPTRTYFNDYEKRCSYKGEDICTRTGKICNYKNCFIMKRIERLNGK